MNFLTELYIAVQYAYIFIDGKKPLKLMLLLDSYFSGILPVSCNCEIMMVVRLNEMRKLSFLGISNE